MWVMGLGNFSADSSNDRVNKKNITLRHFRQNYMK